MLLELQEIILLRQTEPTGFFGLWGAKPVRALDGVSLTLEKGETLGIMGGSGAGKTTLAEAATLRRPIDRGRILLEGNDISKAKGSDKDKIQRRLQMVRQDARDSLDLDQTVRKQLSDRMKQYGLPDPEGRIARALELVELPADFIDRAPQQMSGGQQQRLAIARALALNPVMVALDEPVSGVDEVLQREMLAMLERVQKQQNLGYLLISHERRTIRRLAHRLMIMDAGRVYEVGPTGTLMSEAKHPYSRLFLGLEPGELPFEEDAVGRVIQGCPFAGACPLAKEQCRTAMPALREVAPGHHAACHAL